MEKQDKLKGYKRAIILLVVVMSVYLFFTIGDIILAGYSNKPAYPFIIVVVAIGWLLGLYLKERKNK